MMRLGKLLAARVLNAVAVLLVVALLTFFLVGRAPGDFLDELATNPQVSAETLAQMRAHYGLDRPFYVKFWNWTKTAARGDLGYSFVYQRPIRELVSERVWNTVLLNGLALLAAWTLGIVLGAAAAVARGSVWDWLVGAGTTILLSTPALVLSLVMLGAAAGVGLPVGGMTGSAAETLGLGARLADLARHLVIPVSVVALALLPSIVRHTRTAMAQALAAPFITTARAKGVRPARLLFHHAFRNALNPLTTLFGFSVSALLSASLLVEVVLSWPGIGQLTFDAVLKRDIFLVVDLAVLSAFLLLVGNLAGDLLLYLSDPRTAEP